MGLRAVLLGAVVGRGLGRGIEFGGLEENEMYDGCLHDRLMGCDRSDFRYTRGHLGRIVREMSHYAK